MPSSPTTYSLALASLGLAAFLARPAAAATFTVTTDAGSGPGSFHQAVVEASAASPGEAAEVVFDPVFFGEPRTVVLDVPLPVVRRSLSIEGPAVGENGEPRVTISGDRNGSGVVDDGDLPGLALEVPEEASVTLRRLRFAGCWSKPTPGGAVFFRPTGPAGLTIEQCVFVGNVGRWGGAVSVGGPGHQVVVRGSVFTGNRATEIDSGALHLGASPALVERCVFERNAAPNAGALHTFHGGVELRECLFEQNEAEGFGSGGAVSARFGVRVVGCTFTGNRAWSGGGLFLSEMAADGAGAAIENSTISGNVARGGSGGGLYGVGAVVHLRHCTVTLNEANAEAVADAHAGGGGMAVPGAASANRLHLHNCVVAGNRRSGAAADGGADLLAPVTSLVSLGGNVIGVGGAAAEVFTQTGDVAGTVAEPVDPLLGPLAPNGGLLPTHLPHPESPVIDTGVPGPDPVIAVDQRGLPRPGGAAPDAGAVELTTLAYAEWAGHFLAGEGAPLPDPGAPPSLTSMQQPEADPDGDGVPNVREYLAGGDPLTPSWDVLYRVRHDPVAGTFSVRYLVAAHVPPGAVEVAFDLSETGADWLPVTPTPPAERVGFVGSADEMEVVFTGITTPAHFARMTARLAGAGVE